MWGEEKKKFFLLNVIKEFKNFFKNFFTFLKIFFHLSLLFKNFYPILSSSITGFNINNNFFLYSKFINYKVIL
jgi:hypothetical protein